MNVLVACEFSGVVREAFRKRGHDAWSCDILPAEDGSDYHFKMPIEDILASSRLWDLMIACHPCTDLAVSGAAWFKEKISNGRQQRALDFVQILMDAPIDHICIENPISVISSKIRKPDQIIQPWQFGHETTKATCLWLKNLPKLESADIVSPGARQYYASGKSSPMWHAKTGGGSGHKRSITFQVIADAMAEQWG